LELGHGENFMHRRVEDDDVEHNAIGNIADQISRWWQSCY
jgi:hypothetical protein